MRDAQEDDPLTSLLFSSHLVNDRRHRLRNTRVSPRPFPQTFLGAWTTESSVELLQVRVYPCQSAPFRHPKSRDLFSWDRRKNSVVLVDDVFGQSDHYFRNLQKKLEGSTSLMTQLGRLLSLASSLSFSPLLCRVVSDHLSCLEDPSRQYLSLCHSNEALKNGLSGILQVVVISKA